MNEAVKRCYKFITALYVEMEKLQGCKADEQAYAMGQMKINLTGYMMSLWENRAALDADLAAIESAQQNMHLTAGTSRQKSGSKRKTVTVKKAGSRSCK